MNKFSLSIAVMALLGTTQAHRPHRQNYLQFIDGDFDEDDVTLVGIQRPVSIAEALDKVKSHQEEAPYSQPFAGVSFIQSDPIHGSLGPKKAKKENLTPEQQFEQSQRNAAPPVYHDEKETVVDTNDSIRQAEAIVGHKMPEPTDPKQKKKIQPTPDYPDLDSDDEEDDTLETRKSVKSAEKQLHHRFFINAKDKRDYEKKAIEGRISQQELDFAENEDQEIGQDPKEVEAKQAAKKAKAEEKTQKYLADKEKTEQEKKEEAKAAADEKKIEDAKKPTPTETAGGKSAQAQGKQEGEAFLPPELNPNFHAFAQTGYDNYDDYAERW